MATGEHWFGTTALKLGLIDSIQTSDDYLQKLSKSHKVVAIKYEVKKGNSFRAGGTYRKFINRFLFELNYLKYNIFESEEYSEAFKKALGPEIVELWNKLIQIGFFDWINGGGVGTGADRFDNLLDTFKYTGKHGQALRVNESQQKLETFTIYRI